MPIYRGKALEIKPVDLPLNAEVFQLPDTHEIVATYDEYLARLQQLRGRVWECEATGKQGLTHKQALQSEKDFLMSDETIPDAWRQTGLQLLHHNTKNERDMTDYLYDYFSDNVMVGEIVAVQFDRAPISAKITRIEGDSVGVEFTEETPDGVKEATVPLADVRRDRQHFSKRQLKAFIKRNATREEVYGAPYVVKPFLVKHFKLKTVKVEPIKIKLKLDKYVEDLTLPRSMPPAPHGFPYPSLFRIYAFLTIYSPQLNLSPFTIDDLVSCLKYRIKSTLQNEIFGTLMTLACNLYFTAPQPLPSTMNDFMERYKQLPHVEKTCMDAWYKWVPGRWSDIDRLKAWSVVLVGFLKDCVQCWDIMGKLLFFGDVKWEDLVQQEEEEEEIIEDEKVPVEEFDEEEPVGRLRKRRVEEVYRPRRNGRRESTPPKKKNADEEYALAVENLTFLTERNFYGLEFNERVFLLEKLADFVVGHEGLKEYMEQSFARVSDLKKQLAQANAEVKQVTDKFEKTDVDPSQPLSKRDVSIFQYYRKDEEDQFTAEEKQIIKRAKQVEAQLRQAENTMRLKPIGQDRYFNSYYWIDGAAGACPFQEARGRGRPRLGEIRMMPWATGRLFVEQTGLEQVEDPLDAEYEEQRFGLTLPEVGCYTEPAQIDALMSYLDIKGTREAHLYQALDKLLEEIGLAMRKRRDEIQDMDSQLFNANAFLSYVNKLAK